MDFHVKLNSHPKVQHNYMQNVVIHGRREQIHYFLFVRSNSPFKDTSIRFYNCSTISLSDLFLYYSQFI